MDCKYTFSYRYGINYDKVLYCVDYNEWQKELNKYSNLWQLFSWFSALDRGPEFVMLHLFRNANGDIVDRVCPKGPDFIGVAFGVIAMIVAVGLVTILLWKAFTTIHDRKEFARFEQERQKMKFPSHSNPIFKQATTTIQNPLFNQPE